MLPSWRLNGKLVRTQRRVLTQHRQVDEPVIALFRNASTAPATVSELRRIIQPLRIIVGRRSARRQAHSRVRRPA
jgi:hypothetical protein